MKSSSWKPRTKFLRKWISNSRNPSPLQTFNQCHHFLLQFMPLVRKIFHCSHKNHCSNRPKIQVQTWSTSTNESYRGSSTYSFDLTITNSWGLFPKGIHYLRERLVPFKSAVNACNPENLTAWILFEGSNCGCIRMASRRMRRWKRRNDPNFFGFCGKMHKNLQFVSVKLWQAGCSTVHLVDNLIKTHACYVRTDEKPPPAVVGMN